MAASSDLIVSVSGIRGITGAGLTPATALAFASAYAAYVGPGTVLLGRDGRPSGIPLRHAILAGLLSSDCAVRDLDVAPTPTVGLAVRTLGAAGAIQITASHNPAEWNGLKLFGADGRVLSAAEGAKVKELYERGAGPIGRWSSCRGVADYRRAGDDHRDRVLELVDAAAIRAARFTVLLDANNGAGGPLGLSLLQSLGVTPLCCGGNADGQFLHTPEPTEANLRELAPLVAARGAAVGFALDPDADRLALIDEQGRYIGEELTLALAMQFRLTRTHGPVVINMSTSRVIEDIAARYDCRCERAAVGEANVADHMVAIGAVFGGEGNGGVIDPRVGLVRDPFIGMGLILNLMADTGKKLSELVAALPSYHIVKDRYEVAPQQLPRLYEALMARWPEARVNRSDGLRLDWPDRWLHVRASNTEPIVRAIAEAPARSEAERLCREAGTLLTAK